MISNKKKINKNCRTEETQRGAAVEVLCLVVPNFQLRCSLENQNTSAHNNQFKPDEMRFLELVKKYAERIKVRKKLRIPANIVHFVRPGSLKAVDRLAPYKLQQLTARSVRSRVESPKPPPPRRQINTRTEFRVAPAPL
jgi:hypothetical protein